MPAIMMSVEPGHEISSTDSVDKILEDLQKALQNFSRSTNIDSCDFGLIELHPCHGMGYIHLTDGMRNDNYEPDDFDHKNVGWITLGDWAEIYSEQDGILVIDGISAGGQKGDADVETVFLSAVLPKLRARIASSSFPVLVGSWGVTSGYSVAEAL